MLQVKPQRILKLFDLITSYSRGINFDSKKIKAAFSDSSISSHFLYVTARQNYEMDMSLQRSANSIMRLAEKSENIFSVFHDVAQATGGITETSANPSFLFKKAVDVTKNYYLLYYTPKNYPADGSFQRIKVRVKGKSYKVLHRYGYIAD